MVKSDFIECLNLQNYIINSWFQIHWIVILIKPCVNHFIVATRIPEMVGMINSENKNFTSYAEKLILN